MKPGILRDMFYGSELAEDTPVEIGTPVGHITTRMNLPELEFAFKRLQPTIYYKVVRSGRYTFIYFYLYFPWDKNHLHDWTGGMIVLYDGKPIKLVCRSHWDMVVTEVKESGDLPVVLVSKGDHSLYGHFAPEFQPQWLVWIKHGKAGVISPTLVELTDEHRARIHEYAEDGGITEDDTWSGSKLITWARSWRHRQDYKDLCEKHGLRINVGWKFWKRQFPKPESVYKDHPALFWEIMGVVYG